jgi:mono/diheme cytochrome c family protein
MAAALIAGTGLICTQGRAEAPADLLGQFARAARASEGAFKDFSAQRGEQFFKSRHGSDWSCASCHTDNPVAGGKHAQTGKRIEPLAPAANAVRFTNAAKAEKWFRRNCNDVLGRECTAQEKGDVLAWLMTVRN